MGTLRKILRDEIGAQNIESVLIFGAMLIVGIGLVLMVVQRVTEKLNEFDTATHVVVHENYCAKNKGHR